MLSLTSGDPAGFLNSLPLTVIPYQMRRLEMIAKDSVPQCCRDPHGYRPSSLLGETVYPNPSFALPLSRDRAPSRLGGDTTH